MLTLEDLRSMGACSDAIEAFNAQWPEGTAPLRDVVLALAEHPAGVQWWEWLASQLPALRPAWEEYEATERTASDALAAAERRAWKANVAIEPATLDEYEAVTRRAWRKCEAALRQAIRDAAMNLPPVAA